MRTFKYATWKRILLYSEIQTDCELSYAEFCMEFLFKKVSLPWLWTLVELVLPWIWSVQETVLNFREEIRVDNHGKIKSYHVPSKISKPNKSSYAFGHFFRPQVKIEDVFKKGTVLLFLWRNLLFISFIQLFL